ncbi:MerR family transcriptional regulator [Shimia haliotis]|uniref:MerR HTH family regulatory protein n=1 Tax=Shimia haliotis TaxID=1280847 RepID=A0A1I4ALY9_9RHOB|nr:MerR family transcriptional regulator [Shimia haliotis]SFK57394.1 MerR HTH family regulatory protein [Shimia haliotis]
MAKSRDAFRTISEVAEWLDIQAHVLRFWESKFTQVKPVKRAGGRRYYRRQDMLLLGGIKKLLHDDGLTIKGAQKLLREEGIKHVSSLSQALDEDSTIEATPVPPAPEETAPAAPQQEDTAQTLSLFDALQEQAPTTAAEDTESRHEDVPPEPDTQPEATEPAQAAAETPDRDDAAVSQDDDGADGEAVSGPADSGTNDEVLEDFLCNMRFATHIHPAQAENAAALAARFAALYAVTQETTQA